MNCLIDTHIFLWSLFTPEKIAQSAAGIIKDPGNRIFVSMITFWEISLKYSLNKLELKGVRPDELPEYANRLSYDILDLSTEDAASFYHLPRISHKDPFDRMLIWQAIREKLTLVTRDSKISDYEEFGLKLLS